MREDVTNIMHKRSSSMQGRLAASPYLPLLPVLDFKKFKHSPKRASMDHSLFVAEL